ncbi:cuticle collagen 7-like [Pteropus medius]|uniref:cuticle collagen 7-like n=1 Tax=Pteropus vampyrus TaxID=132908 RepID=UPI00196B6C84|nr:cuticle collagen 7-like [Pteropus giganteus]
MVSRCRAPRPPPPRLTPLLRGRRRSRCPDNREASACRGEGRPGLDLPAGTREPPPQVRAGSRGSGRVGGAPVAVASGSPPARRPRTTRRDPRNAAGEAGVPACPPSRQGDPAAAASAQAWGPRRPRRFCGKHPATPSLSCRQRGAGWGSGIESPSSAPRLTSPPGSQLSDLSQFELKSLDSGNAHSPALFLVVQSGCGAMLSTTLSGKSSRTRLCPLIAPLPLTEGPVWHSAL